MNFAQKLVGDEEERAVSPVIGVILMVAITVILAAVIAAFVLDLGQSMGDGASPTLATDSGVNDEWDDSLGGSSQELFYVSHQSGDSIEGEDIRVVVRDANSGAAIASLGASDWTDTESGTSAASNDVNLEFVLDLDDSSASNVPDNSFSGGSTLTVSTTATNDDTTDDEEGNELIAGDELKIQLIHVPSDTTVSEHTHQVP